MSAPVPIRPTDPSADAVACANCRFFKRAVLASGKPMGHGDCRLWPPSVEDSGGNCWPIVQLGDWCGQYKQPGEKDEPPLPYIPSVLDLKPGDTLWLRSAVVLSEIAKRRVAQQLQKALAPGVRMIIGEQGLEPVAVLRSGPDGDPAV